MQPFISSFYRIEFAALVFLAGVLLLLQFAVLPSLWWAWGLVPVWFVARRFSPLILIFWFGIGFLWTVFQAQERLSATLPDALEGQTVEVVGKIASIPQQKESGAIRFLLDVEEMRTVVRKNQQSEKTEIIPFNAIIRLNWYQRDFNLSPLKLGERWRLAVRLKQPHGFMNPDGFDYEGWLFQQGIRATGYVYTGSRPHSAPEKLAEVPKHSIDEIRGRLFTWIQQQTKSESETRQTLAGGVLAALVVGERSGLDQSAWTVFRQTGTAHLMAISGLHIGLVAGLCFFLFRWVWSRCYRLLLWIPAQQVGAVGGLSSALFYAALAGFSVPTQRALIMVSVVMGALLLKRPTQPWPIYFLAMLAVLLFDPFAPLNAGFWLSFGAVGLILYALRDQFEDAKQNDSKEGIKEDANQELENGVSQIAKLWRLQQLRKKWDARQKPKFVRGFFALVKMQWVLSLGMLPMMFYLFRDASIVGIVANLIAVPWVSLVVVPVTLLAALLHLFAVDVVAMWLLQAAAWAVELLWPLLVWFSGLKFSHLPIHQIPLWIAMISTIGALLLLTPKKLLKLGKLRWLGGVLLLFPLLGYAPDRPLENQAWVTVLDVGQGLAVVVETQDRVLLYDTGPAFSKTFDAGSAVIVPFLQSRGWKQIDLLMVGHGDSDHSGGLKSVVEKFPVQAAFSSEPEILAEVGLAQSKIGMCGVGQNWQWGNMELEVLHPQKVDQADQSDESLNGNNRSCVLKVTANGESVLISGDIEHEAEMQLLQRFSQTPDILQADYLIAPHHGSNTSSTEKLLEAVTPKWAIFSVGYRNRFGFPRENVVNRYQKRDIQRLKTSGSGAVQIRLGEKHREKMPSAWREESRRFWHD